MKNRGTAGSIPDIPSRFGTISGAVVSGTLEAVMLIHIFARLSKNLGRPKIWNMLEKIKSIITIGMNNIDQFSIEHVKPSPPEGQFNPL